MKKKGKPLLAIFGCAGLSFLGFLGIFVAGVLVVLAVLGLFFATGYPFSNTPWDRAMLRSIREPYLHVPAALEAHHTAHGSYPATPADLDTSSHEGIEAAAILGKGRLRYSSDGTSYFIHLKLNWDGGLSYSSAHPVWVFGMNDEPSWPID